jgi:hypothetical protein
MTNEAKQQWIIWWVLWLAFQGGIFFIYHFVGKGIARPAAPAESAIWLLGFVPIAISAFVRWAVLPRIESATAALPMFIVGIAMAEVACFLGLFIFPAHRQELFGASAAGIFQFIPFFARRYFPPG